MLMRGASHDLRVAGRLLIRTPAATIGVLASLAVGVGACATIFSWINGILIQPFPAVARSGQYVVLASQTPSGALEPLSYPGYLDIHEAAPVFDNLVVNANCSNAGRVADASLRIAIPLLVEIRVPTPEMGLNQALKESARSSVVVIRTLREVHLVMEVREVVVPRPLTDLGVSSIGCPS
jgi:hypothetical protein